MTAFLTQGRADKRYGSSHTSDAGLKRSQLAARHSEKSPAVTINSFILSLFCSTE